MYHASLCLRLCWVLTLLTQYVQAKAAFAHFMVSNAANYSVGDWANDIQLAQAARIDAFALNMAHNQNEGPQLANAFAAARAAGHKLFFSFDYAGDGPWPETEVIQLLHEYAGNGAYYHHNGQPFVSTFEGPDNAPDWINIKAQTGCFLVPDWSSKGAKVVAALAGGVADGLFSWAAWPWGNRNMDTFVDASYLQYLGNKPYMMPVSPWFYTNLPGYDKNWLWRGDSLWFDRLQQMLFIQPEWIEIISWNDYGESHYIGPIIEKALGALNTGKAPYDYVRNMPHDGWREILPFALDLYVRNSSIVSDDRLVYWYRPQPAAACGSGDTPGNTATQLQIEFDPKQVAQDRVFYTALLDSLADVTVSIGGVSQTGTWSDVPDIGVGLFHGSVPFNGNTGDVVVTVSRHGNVLMTSQGKAITTQCDNGFENWNAWVGSTRGASHAPAPATMDKEVCINGTSIGNFAGLCAHSCSLGYCPVGACQCTALGRQRPYPEAQNISAYPAAGLDANYGGLCAFDCNYGYCPPTACALTESPLTTPTISPFTPDACTSGTGEGQWEGLCNYSCNFGFCPIGRCKCLSQGSLHLPPPQVNSVSGVALNGVNDFGLCDFACSRGDYCPPEVCSPENAAGAGPGGPVIPVDPSIWKTPNPTVSCLPPCTIVLPPYTLPTPTTISFPPLTETFTESFVSGQPPKTTVIVVTFPPVTTTEIPVFNLNITASGVDHLTYTVTPSIIPSTTIVISPPPGVSGTSDTITISSTYDPSHTPKLTNTPTQVTQTSKIPRSTCTAGCGRLCKHNCNACDGLGCIFPCVGCNYGNHGGHNPCLGLFCPPKTCIGSTCPPNSDGGADGDGEGDGEGDGDGNKSCTSSNTAQICTVSCSVIKRPQASTLSTTCYSTKCSSTIGCSVTPKTTTTETTDGCDEPITPYTKWYSNTDVPAPTPTETRWAFLLKGNSNFAGPGTSTAFQPSNTPVTSVLPNPTPTPTNTAFGSGTALCYEPNPFDPGNPNIKFTMVEYNNVIAAFCAKNFKLEANAQQPVSTGVAPPHSNGELEASVGWAVNQQGCAPEKELIFSDNGFSCSLMWLAIKGCAASDGSSYGGEFIYNGPSGCLRISMRISEDGQDHIPRKRDTIQRNATMPFLGHQNIVIGSNNASTPIGSQYDQKIHADQLGEMEMELDMQYGSDHVGNF